MQNPTLQATLMAALSAKVNDYRPRTHHLDAHGAPVYINRLILETSPYLLQHAHNPVNWYPWGDEALKKAKTENKLMIISIGYSVSNICV